LEFEPQLSHCTAKYLHAHFAVLIAVWERVYNNNNNNDRLTAFDPGQPG